MTTETEDSIARFMLTLSVHCGHLDLTQIDGIVHSICQRVEEQERERVLQILATAERRMNAGKGRNWRVELSEAQREVEMGHQRLFN